MRYLAGREAWLSERTRKRKERDEAETAGAGEKRKNPQDPCLLAEDSVAAQAARALNQWFQHLGQGTLEWRADAGLDGWRKALMRAEWHDGCEVMRIRTMAAGSKIRRSSEGCLLYDGESK